MASLIFGSARHAENGGSGWDNKAISGDQKQTKTPDYSGEVSMQDFYVHSKGWYVFRFVDPTIAEKFAQQVINACNNIHIGYDQSQRDTLWNYVKTNNIKDISKVTSNVETDCSALMRACIYIVTGVDVGNIRTVSMPNLMPKATLNGKKLFETVISYTSSTKLYNGDILVTKTSGHTGAIVSGSPRIATAQISNSTDSTSTSTPIQKGLYRVTASVLNVRASAGTNSKILGTLKEGTPVYVTSIVNGWASFKYKDSVTAWLSTKYLKLATTTNYKVLASSLYVRSGPSTSYSTVGTVHKGNLVPVCDVKDGWATIVYNEGIKYCSANTKYLTKA